MSQTSFFPTQCNRTKPKPTGADADFIAICDATTERYLCKGQSKYPHLPSTEWICSSLARDVGLPVPPFTVIEMITDPGVYLFGSQWISGGLDFTIAFSSVSNPDLFSKIFGVDWFVHNDDRHLGNYLYIEIQGDVILRPMDFSRSWKHHGWPLPDLPLNWCNTLEQMPYWQALFGYVKPEDILDKIAALPAEWMDKTLANLPQAWISDSEREDYIQWWKASGRQARVIQAKSTLP